MKVSLSLSLSLFLFLFGCAAGAFGQNYLSSEPQKFTVPDHPGHAANHVMAKDQNLRGDDSPYTYAQGEMPLREAVQASRQIPLGDIARQVRKDHQSDKKASIVWAN